MVNIVCLSNNHYKAVLCSAVKKISNLFHYLPFLIFEVKFPRLLQLNDSL